MMHPSFLGLLIWYIDEDGSVDYRRTVTENSSDIDGDALSITDLIGQGDGELSANNDGSWTFTPSKDWNGDVQINYSVTDSRDENSYKVNEKVFVRGNSLYTIVKGDSWSEAEKNSNGIGGHLVTINNQEEATFLSQKIYKNPANEQLNSHFFIGLNDVDIEGEYEWSSGEKCLVLSPISRA